MKPRRWFPAPRHTAGSKGPHDAATRHNPNYKIENMRLTSITPLAKTVIMFLAAVAGNLLNFAAHANEGTSFPVIGEQLDHAPPPGWKLAWMTGKADGTYGVEYIPAEENIKTWRGGYLAIARMEYPSAEIRKEIENSKTRVADIALLKYGEVSKKTCGGTHEQMSQRTSVFNGIYFGVSGGFCDKYGPMAPFGEGSVYAFIEGKDYLFRIQYGWRPLSADDQKEYLPWRIAPQKVRGYVEAIRTTTLCGGEGQKMCDRF